VAVAPTVLVAGLLYHPHIGDPFDPDFMERLARTVAADPARWAVAHYATALGSGLLALAFIAIRGHLRDAGETRWSALGLPFVVLGSFLYGLLPAMEFAPLAALHGGADLQAVEATQGALYPWFLPTMFAGAVLFAAGAVAMARAILASSILGPTTAWLVAGGLFVAAVSRFIPLSAVQFHVQSLALLAAAWPLAQAMWRRPAREAASYRHAASTV
jgi:hypothetical protein